MASWYLGHKWYDQFSQKKKKKKNNCHMSLLSHKWYDQFYPKQTPHNLPMRARYWWFLWVTGQGLWPYDSVWNSGGRSVLLRLSDIWAVFYELKICPTFLTVQCCYNMVHFLKNPPNRHPIAHLWGWAMDCLLWDQILLLSLQCCM